ncbi:MAG: hypothetical protein AUJ96_17885 [Armatimonadetes bacterium CG2_30_66_41]|nr:YjbH domain-containing protein [Armatimonadota bacterium]OIP01073.1 MAG: hypothetical protein AUJ96_17885 [Armatimonadetes bacterium CG2_30_66_41]PIX46894.1 MAG: hypothetical protein COZ57_09980 [Armatimonadetes bacterium CG_4_8_14_3_um_filter_66_20]PJB68866.1 MAG: hypothetical protein CO096_14090 [Armatimonadetes bacterium CG_4_9_14_3_um_filter_66_14]
MKFSKQPIVAVAAAFCLVCCLGVAGADTSIYGPTGMVLNPTADLAPVGVTEGTIMWFNQDNTANGGGDVDWMTLSAVGGARNDSEFNIGYNRLDVKQGLAGWKDEADGLIAGMKFRLSEESEKLPAIAGGVSYFSASGLYERTAVYLCATRNLSLPQEGNLGLRGTAGLRWTDAEYSAVSKSDIIPFVGVEARLAPKLNLILELESEHKFPGARTNTPFSAMLRYRATENLLLHVGALNTGFEDSSAVGVGISYIWERVGWR